MIKSCDRILSAVALGICFCLAAMLLGSPVSAQSTFGAETAAAQAKADGRSETSSRSAASREASQARRR